MQDLFTQALGIYSPWFVKDVEFNNKQLNSYIDFKRGMRFVDGSDDIKAYGTHDTKMKKYRHMNFFEHECHLHVRVPRIKRDDGKVRLILSPWAGQLNGFSTLFEAFVIKFCKHMPVHNVCQLMNISDGYTKILVTLLRLTLFIMTDFANFLREILGITDYFMISEIKKKAYPKKTIEIHLTYSPKVYKVSGKEYRLYDQSPERKWQHLSWFDYTCFIVCSLPRYVDDNGKVKVIAVSFASKGKGYTRLFSQKIIEYLLLVKDQKTVATLFQTTPYIVSSIMEKAVENGLDERGEINDFEHVSIDEKELLLKARG